jgi:hypothetical protein
LVASFSQVTCNAVTTGEFGSITGKKHTAADEIRDETRAGDWIAPNSL